jgi:hypothetical protein
LQGRAELARYSHLPLGNMGVDWVIPTADAIYARCLRDAGHLLWISDPSLPDVAARSSDTNVVEELLEKNQLSMEVGTHCKSPILSRESCLNINCFAIFLNKSLRSKATGPF